MNEERDPEPEWGSADAADESGASAPTGQWALPPLGAGSSNPYPSNPHQLQPAPWVPVAQPWQPPNPPPRSRSLLPFFLIGLAAVLVAAVVGTVVYIRQSVDDPGQPVAGQLRGTFPTKPSVTWRLDADDIVRGGIFVRPDTSSQRYHGSGFIDLGDTLITTVMVADADDEPPELVAIDAESGEVRWTSPDVGFRTVCATETVGGLLPCIGHERAGYRSSKPSVKFYRLSNGDLDREIAVDDGVTEVDVHDSAVYTFGYDVDEESTVVARGTSTDLEADWQESIPFGDSDDSCVGSGDYSIYGATDRFVYTGSDIGVTVLNAADGSPAVRGEVQGVEFHPGQGFTGHMCERPGDPVTVNSMVFDEEGQVLSSVSTGWQESVSFARNWLVTPSADRPYVLGRTAYKFATGEPLWEASGASDVTAMRYVIGDTVLGGGFTVPDAEPVPLAAFDMATGDNLWSADVYGYVDMSDGQRVLVRDEDKLVSINRGSGEQEWTVPVSGDLDEAGRGFAAAEAEQITYYDPTGGPAVAPGRMGASDSSSDQASTGLITRCGSEPEMRPVEYRADDGGLVVKMEISATCPGGDIVSTTALNVAISDDIGTIAAGIFDFSDDPLYLPGDNGSGGAASVEQELRFGLGSFFRLPNSLGASGSSSGTGPVTAGGNQLVECTDEGISDGPTSVDNAPNISGVKSRTAIAPGAVSRDPEAVALDALRAQANADKPFILSDLAERWVPQVSSKQPGLVATDVDGVTMVTWTAQEILNQHLRLRLMYPEVRLLWSDEWSSFDIRSWWVTVAGLTFSGSEAANGWCDANAIPVNECFAKLVSNTRGPEGTTDYRS
ncbi:MAG: PQQ-binding-like beta-propeller repeat protein [Mycobacterium sp.]